MKDLIVERLLEQGHITIAMADALLNNLIEKTRIVTDLTGDGIITNTEAIILLKENDQVVYYPPIQPQVPTMPWQPYSPGNPHWHVTCTMDPGFNRD